MTAVTAALTRENWSRTSGTVILSAWGSILFRIYDPNLIVPEPSFLSCIVQCYYSIRTDRLETLIPKSEGGVVMVVRGEGRGQLGRVVVRDKARCLATVQLIHTEQVLDRLDYDSVCEFVGPVPDDD